MTIDPGIKHSGGPLPGGPEDSGEVVAPTPLAETAATSSVFTVQDSISTSDAKVSISYTSSAQHPSIEPANSKKVTSGDQAYNIADALDDPNALDGTGPAINDPTGVSPPKTSGDAAVVQLKLGEEFQKTMQSFVDKMSDSDPKKVVYQDFLKQISSALSELARIIQENSIGDAEKSKDMSNTELDVAQKKLRNFEDNMKKQQEAEAKAKEAGEKMSWMDKMSAPMGGLGIAMTCVLMCTVGVAMFMLPPVGWIGLAMLTNSLVDQVLKERGERVDLNQSPLSIGMDGGNLKLEFNWEAKKLTDKEKAEGKTAGSWSGVVDAADHTAGCLASMLSLNDPTDPNGGPQELKFTLKFYMIATMAYSMGPAALMGGGSNMSDFVKDSGIIKETAKEMKPSISDQDLMIAEMAVTMTITLTCAVISFVFGFGASSIFQSVRLASVGTKMTKATEDLIAATTKAEQVAGQSKKAVDTAKNSVEAAKEAVAAARAEQVLAMGLDAKILSAEKEVKVAQEVLKNAKKPEDIAEATEKLTEAQRSLTNLKEMKSAILNPKIFVQENNVQVAKFEYVMKDGSKILKDVPRVTGGDTNISLALEKAVMMMDKAQAKVAAQLEEVTKPITRPFKEISASLSQKIEVMKSAAVLGMSPRQEKVMRALLNALERIVMPGNPFFSERLGRMQAPVMAASTAAAVEKYKADTMKLNAQADAVKFKAEMDSYMEETNALIANLKKVIQMLMEALEGATSSLTAVGDTQRNMLDGLRNSLPN